jgi:uncharacterized protein YlxW (UPF0749 family)
MPEGDAVTQPARRSFWRTAFRRAGDGLLPGRSGRTGPRSRWSAGVPLIALAAGLLFTTTAKAADGTALREDRRPQLAQVVEEHRERVAASEERVRQLEADIDSRTSALAGSDSSVKAARDRAEAERQAAGFTALHGPGLTIKLNDAPQHSGGLPADARPDDLVVHQGDVQAVVNALWAGGAEAMSIMDVRVLSTSAVRCVGNTLFLHGRVYSPPFKITAIGDPAAMRAALAASQGVQLFKDAVEHYQLGYQETVEKDVTVPAFDGSSALRSAEVAK